MKYYSYFSSGEYSGSGDAGLSPLQKDVYLLPAAATFIAPPPAGANEVAVWNGQAWEIKPDFRGETVYHTETGLPVLIIAIGPLPENVTPQQPPEKLAQYYRWDGVAWTPDESKRGQLQQLAGSKIDAETAGLLNAGFEFDGEKFPLFGDMYSQNMAAASAYVIRQQTAGRNLYTLAGNFHLVTDIAGLVAAGDDMATGICMSAITRKNALSGKTAAELIQIINNTNQ